MDGATPEAVPAVPPRSIVSMRPENTTGPMYAPDRDHALCWKGSLLSLNRAFERDYWPQLVDIMRVGLALEAGTEPSNEELELALQKTQDVFVRFLVTCCEDSTETVEAVLKRAGWDELPHAVRFGWCAMFGTVHIGQIFAGLRDVNGEGDSPPRTAFKALKEIAAMTAVRIAQTGLPWQTELIKEFRQTAASALLAGVPINTLNDQIATALSDVAG